MGERAEGKGEAHGRGVKGKDAVLRRERLVCVEGEKERERDERREEGESEVRGKGKK